MAVALVQVASLAAALTVEELGAFAEASFLVAVAVTPFQEVLGGASLRADLAVEPLKGALAVAQFQAAA